MEKKILIVEDDPDFVKYLTALFEDHGYKTFSASTVKDALDMTKKELPDLITLDLELPGEWGPPFFQENVKG